MKIESVRIENFRSFKDETIFFDDYTCFVGPNGAGKSTVFYALNIFFRQYKDSKTDLFRELLFIFPEIENATVKADMIASLHAYETKYPEYCVLIPSEDQFYGATRGVNRLAPHIQWVFVSASKDATEESEESKTSALGQLLARTVRSKISFDEKVNELRVEAKKQYQVLLDAEQSALDDISTSLQNRLAAWAHPNLSAKVLWKQDPEKSIKVEEPWAYIKIGERGFEGDLFRFGHGLQRSFMLALLQELALIDEENAPTLIMGIEEPELYQHPPQARYLAETLLELSEKDTQLLLCTHNPLFIPGDNFDKIRIVRECGNPSYTKITSVSYDNLSHELERVGERLLKESGMVAKLYPSLNPVINEMFFCKVLILVEGQEDIAYITSYLMLTGAMIEFRTNGCHIVPVDGKNRLIKPIAMAKLLDIPTKVIFDADTNKTREFEVIQHKKENSAILNLQGHEEENEWPLEHIIHDNLSCWQTNLTDTIKTEFGADWQKYRDKAASFYDNAGDLEKNPLAIAKTLELAWANGKQSKILLDLIERIINFAREATSR